MDISASSLVQQDSEYIWHPFTQHGLLHAPIAVKRGEGSYLYDENNQQYLDLISSWWVNCHGHSHPVIAHEIAKQALKLGHVIFAGFTHEPAIQLAQKLVDITPPSLQKVFFSDNGSTAVEVALKMAIQYWYNRDIKRSRIVSLEGAYHGDTFGAMAAGKTSQFFLPFEEYLFAVDSLPFPETWDNDCDVEIKEQQTLRVAEHYFADHGHEVAALIVEPLIQGASGMRFCRPQFLEALISLARQTGALIIFDEVMTGFGRTGTLFACDQVQNKPDILCLSKALTGGFLPLAVTLCRQEIYQEFLSSDINKAFLHGHSYTAHPLGCAAANASIMLFEQEKSMERVCLIHDLHCQYLQQMAQIPGIEKCRSMGPIAAFNISGEGGYNATISQKLRQAFVEEKLIIRPLGPVVYLLPPYCINLTDLKHVYERMDAILRKVLKN
jgi:adenosylmethionine-8-amino-7-oxononanoate aminotransferase